MSISRNGQSYDKMKLPGGHLECLKDAERHYADGYWDEAETLYLKVLKGYDLLPGLATQQSRQRQEALSRLFEIASGMHREDDAEIWAGMLRGGIGMSERRLKRLLITPEVLIELVGAYPKELTSIWDLPPDLQPEDFELRRDGTLHFTVSHPSFPEVSCDNVPEVDVDLTRRPIRREPKVHI